MKQHRLPDVVGYLEVEGRVPPEALEPALDGADHVRVVAVVVVVHRREHRVAVQLVLGQRGVLGRVGAHLRAVLVRGQGRGLRGHVGVPDLWEERSIKKSPLVW